MRLSELFCTPGVLSHRGGLFADVPTRACELFRFNEIAHVPGIRVRPTIQGEIRA